MWEKLSMWGIYGTCLQKFAWKKILWYDVISFWEQLSCYSSTDLKIKNIKILSLIPHLLQLISFHTLAAMLSNDVHMATIFSSPFTLQLIRIWLSSPLLKLFTSLPKAICKFHMPNTLAQLNPQFSWTTQRIWASSPLLFSQNNLVLFDCLFLFSFLRFYLLIFREKGKERETYFSYTSHRLVASHKPQTPQPRHVPWPGIEPVTFQLIGQCPANWATPVRAKNILFSKSLLYSCFPSFLFCLSSIILGNTSFSTNI